MIEIAHSFKRVGEMAKKDKQKLPELSRLELDVMNVVWDLGECGSADVIAAYRKTRPLAETTIRTVLTHLREKGYIEPVPAIARGYRFRPIVSREAVAARSLKSVVKNLFGGSPRLAILHLLEKESISEDELKEIRRMIDQSAKGGKSK